MIVNDNRGDHTVIDTQLLKWGYQHILMLFSGGAEQCDVAGTR